MLPKGGVASTTESAGTLGEGIVGNSGGGTAPSLDCMAGPTRRDQGCTDGKEVHIYIHRFQAISSHPVSHLELSETLLSRCRLLRLWHAWRAYIAGGSTDRSSGICSSHKSHTATLLGADDVLGCRGGMLACFLFKPTRCIVLGEPGGTAGGHLISGS